MLKLFVRNLLLLVVLLGLASQGIARETAPCKQMAQAEMAAMHGMAGMAAMPDCPGMRNAGKGKAPCKDMSLGCFATANCPAGIASAAEPQLDALIPPPLLAAIWPAMQALHGREIAPDPNPPAHLG